jgi:CRP-like cAMP-binding protein
MTATTAPVVVAKNGLKMGPHLATEFNYARVEEAAKDPGPVMADWIQRSKKANMLAELTEEEIGQLFFGGEYLHYEPGDIVIPWMDTKDSVFVLMAEGRVRIITPIILPPPVGDWLSGEKSLLEIPAPQLVGHFNLLSSTVRSATVEAVTPLDTIEIQKNYVEMITKANMHIGATLFKNMGRALQGQLRFTNNDVQNLTVAVALASRALRK